MAELFRSALDEGGYDADVCATLADVSNRIVSGSPDLILLDLSLPDGDGVSFCKELRSGGTGRDLPVIAVTGRCELTDKKEGYIAGIDYYLTKPVDIEELLLCVGSLLRRVKMDLSCKLPLDEDSPRVDPGSHLIWYRGRAVVGLTRREFELFYALFSSRPRILSRSEIISRVWRTASVGNLVDVHLFNLRRKLPRELAGRIQFIPGKGIRYLEKR